MLFHFHTIFSSVWDNETYHGNETMSKERKVSHEKRLCFTL